MVLERSQDFLNFKILPGPCCNEDASVFAVNWIYFRASLKLFCFILLRVKRTTPLGDSEICPGTFLLRTCLYFSMKEPPKLAKIYLAKVAISQVPYKVIMVDLTSGIIHILKC